MRSTIDLTQAVPAVAALLEELRAFGRGSAEATRRGGRRPSRTAYRDSVAALRAATGARKHQAEAWLRILQTAVGALRWQNDAHHDDLVELLDLVVRAPRDDERYASLMEMIDAESQTGSVFYGNRTRLDDPAVRAQINERIRRGRSKQLDFVRAWYGQ